jgi:hypothetical protein
MNNKLILLLSSVLFLTACESLYDDPWYHISDSYPDKHYAILNNGSYGMSDASLGKYDRKTLTYYYKEFEVVNELKLGDTAQDIIQYGDKLYVSVSGSKTIFVTDKNFKIIKTLSPDQCQPRYFTSHEGKVYVSLYEGYLGEIDTLDFSFRKVKVGQNPEGIVMHKEKVYVANSGGMNYPYYANSVSVVDPKSLTVEDSLKVNTNPCRLFSRDKYLYIHSYGDYDTIEPKLEVYQDGKLSDTGYKNVSMVAQYEDAMYVLTNAYESEGAHIYMHSAAKNTRVGSFLPAGAILLEAYSISATRYFLWVGCSDYVTTGDILMFDRLTGQYNMSFDARGMNPQKVIEIQ